MMFPSTYFIDYTPMDIYNHNNDISMLLQSICTSFAFNCQLIVVFDGNDELCMFSPRRRRRAVITSAPESQAVVFIAY